MADLHHKLRNPQLDGSAFFWPKGDVAVLCLHGFTATTVEVRKMAGFLSEQGYSVKAPLLPGHGSSAEEMNKTQWQDWYCEAEKSYLELAERYQDVFVLGESMGGLLTLHLARQHPRISGILLFAPAIQVKNLWLSKILWPFVPAIKKKPPDNDLPQQSYTEFPLRAAASLFELQKIVRKELTQIRTPVRIFQGKHDDTIDPLGALLVYENIASLDKELVIITESCHLILLDKQMPEVQLMTHAFIQAVLKRNP